MLEECIVYSFVWSYALWHICYWFTWIRREMFTVRPGIFALLFSVPFSGATWQESGHQCRLVASTATCTRTSSVTMYNGQMTSAWHQRRCQTVQQWARSTVLNRGFWRQVAMKPEYARWLVPDFRWRSVWCYHPPMWRGDVFSSICLSVCNVWQIYVGSR